MDRLKREGNPPVGQLASPVPQYKGAADWETLEGEGGASFVKDRDAIAKLEQVRALLSGVATEDKLEQARTLLQSLAGKDFATQATLAQVKSELELVKAELATIKANQLSGDQKVQVSGAIVDTLADYSEEYSAISKDALGGFIIGNGLTWATNFAASDERMINIDRYNKLTVLLRNTTDQPLASVAIGLSTRAANVFSENLQRYSKRVAVDDIPAGASWLVDTTDIPALGGGAYRYLILTAKLSAATTSGGISITILGARN